MKETFSQIIDLRFREHFDMMENRVCQIQAATQRAKKRKKPTPQYLAKMMDVDTMTSRSGFWTPHFQVLAFVQVTYWPFRTRNSNIWISEWINKLSAKASIHSLHLSISGK